MLYPAQSDIPWIVKVWFFFFVDDQNILKFVRSKQPKKIYKQSPCILRTSGPYLNSWWMMLSWVLWILLMRLPSQLRLEFKFSDPGDIMYGDQSFQRELKQNTHEHIVHVVPVSSPPSPSYLPICVTFLSWGSLFRINIIQVPFEAFTHKPLTEFQALCQVSMIDSF